MMPTVVGNVWLPYLFLIERTLTVTFIFVTKLLAMQQEIS